MAKKCKRKTVTKNGRTIVLPCRASKLTSAHMNTLDSQLTAADWNKARTKKCRVVFFTKTRVGVRCKGRKLSASAKRRFKAMGGKRACMTKRGKRLRFKSC
jgi:hypothetical protein